MQICYSIWPPKDENMARFGHTLQKKLVGQMTFQNFLGGILLVCYKGYLSRTHPVEKASVAICSVKKHKMPIL